MPPPYTDFNKVWGQAPWMGRTIHKCPFDLWIYAEIIYKNRPDLIIETGTENGGGTLLLAQMCDLVGNGKVVSIDLKELSVHNPPSHPRLTHLVGDAVSPRVVSAVKLMVNRAVSVMVILDDDYEDRKHVIRELEVYAPLVTLDNYIVVERTSWKAGAALAVEEFVERTDSFVVDYNIERYPATYNHTGYLKRIQ